MQRRVIPRFGRATLSLVAVAAWLLASNHCVLAEWLKNSPTAMAESHCAPEKDSAPKDQQGDCDGSKCCRSLSAASLAFVKSVLTKSDAPVSAALFFPSLSDIASRLSMCEIEEIDTGPPDGWSFVEGVLQRSVLAHAPPLFVS